MSCHSNSCSGEEHSNHSHHHHGSCGCSCHDQGHGHSEHAHGEGFAHQLLELADEAWMEVLKEKIKENIRQNAGDHLTQLAALVSERNHKHWSQKLGERNQEDEFEHNLQNLMCGQSCKK